MSPKVELDCGTSEPQADKDALLAHGKSQHSASVVPLVSSPTGPSLPQFLRTRDGRLAHEEPRVHRAIFRKGGERSFNPRLVLIRPQLKQKLKNHFGSKRVIILSRF